MSDAAGRVVGVVRSIPPGTVMTYGDVAREAGTVARVVGRILHRVEYELPWWRVVNIEGRPYPGAIRQALAEFEREGTPASR